jgi:hypothetical protein
MHLILDRAIDMARQPELVRQITPVRFFKPKIKNEKEILPVSTYYEWIKPKPHSKGR